MFLIDLLEGRGTGRDESMAWQLVVLDIEGA
jgi:hypothetical protein